MFSLFLLFSSPLVWYEEAKRSFFLSLCRCRYTHDIDAYLAAKPADLRVPRVDEISEEPPFNVRTLDGSSATPHPKYPNLDMGTVCSLFAERGECRYVCLFVAIHFSEYFSCTRYGFKCRFLGRHVRTDKEGNVVLVGDEDKKACSALTAKEVNLIGPETQKLLGTKKVCFPSFFFAWDAYV